MHAYDSTKNQLALFTKFWANYMHAVLATMYVCIYILNLSLRIYVISLIAT